MKSSIVVSGLSILIVGTLAKVISAMLMSEKGTSNKIFEMKSNSYKKNNEIKPLRRNI